MHSELSPKATEIADYAEKLIETGGYKNFSYADIAAKVKITKASIHHHFSNKSELVRVVVQRYSHDALRGMAAIERKHDDPLSKLIAYVEYWATCLKGAETSFCLCAMLAYEIETLPESIAEEVRKHVQDLMSWLTCIFEEGHNSGQFFLQSTPDIEAKSFMATIYGAMLSVRSLGDPDTFNQLLRLTLSRLTSPK